MTQPNTTKPSPTRFTLLLAVLGLLALANGCTMNALDLPDTSSRSSGGHSSSNSDDNASGGAPAEEEGPVTVPFDKLVVQTVQWFDKDVTIEKAETTTTPRETWGGETLLEREHTITLKVQNRTQASSELESENWDLILADGTRLRGSFDGDFGPKDVLRFERSFSGEEHDLEGAYFELNEYTYGEYEPLILPLDRPVDQEQVLSLDSVVGQTVTSDAEDSGWKYEILSARVAMNSEVESDSRPGTRAKVGKKLLELVVRSTNLNNDARNLYDTYYHLNVDGSGVSTGTDVNELPEGGEKLDVPVVFQVDAAATELDIELVVEHGTKDTWKTLHVDLANATPVE